MPFFALPSRAAEPRSSAAAENKPVPDELKPDNSDEPVPPLFEDMGVVQKRAMAKSGKFLISNFGALDFSDGPYSMYSFNLNPGYAFSDFFEAYISFVPFFISTPRRIVSELANLQLANGASASISFAKPKMQYGAEILWAPAYGKDSIGSTSVIRSDTFLKAGVMMVQYDGGNGIKLHSGIGKTYFIDRWLGFRAAATANYLQTILGGTKSFSFIAIVEAGFVFYL